MPTANRPSSIRFADCELDRRTGELWRNGQRLLLPDQPFRVLDALVRQPGVLVTREELQRELWPDGTFVDYEHSLNAAVKRLRELIGDSATAPLFIETVPRRGYRFIAPVEDGAAPPEQAVPAIVEPAVPAAVEPENPINAPRPPASTSTWRKPGAVSPVAAMAALAAIASIYWLAPTRVADPPRGAPPVRLTTASGVNADPALSWDGTLMAYASGRTGAGHLDIWVQKIGGSSPIRLTTAEGDESDPSFSRDGAEIVYSQRNMGLFVIGSLGGNRRLIVETPWARTPRFSPDGRSIVYWTGFPAFVVSGGIPGALGSMFIVPAAGGAPRILQTHLASARYPIWSADGSRILFLGEEDPDQKAHDWYVIGPEGGQAIKTGAFETMRAAGLQTRFPMPGAWIPSGDMVIFASNESDSSNLWQIPINPASGRVTGPAEPLTFGTAIERQPTVSAGGRIVFTSVSENVDIWRLPLDPRTGVATGAPERLTHDAASDRLRNVSTDGRRIVFISSRTGWDEVWLKDLDSGQERRVTHAGVDDASGSPDGAKVAFSRRDGAASRIDLIDIDGGVPVKLCEQCDSPSDWSPEGSRILFNRGRPSRLELVEIPSGQSRTLVAHPHWSVQLPRFSQDGGWVAFHTANSPNVRQVYAVPVSRSGAVTPEHWVPIVTDHGCHPSWSVDGSLLFHFSFRDGAFCPWVQPIDPHTKRPVGEPYAVHHFHQAGLRAASGAAAFNDVQGGFLYLSLTQATSQIWMLETAAARVAARR